MTGVIVLNKPQEFTSFDAVAVMRGLAKEKKIGHTGTLDPMATGVLPLLLGRGTKAADLLPDTEKSYEAHFRVGTKTDTGDCWGREKATSGERPTRADFEGILPEFRGDILQVPPMYSAVSIDGQRLYKLARQGIEVQREARPVNVSELELVSYNGEEGILKITCSKGTYIRSLIEDMAEKLGALATMTALTRTAACGFTIEEAMTLEDLRALAQKGALESVLRPIENLFLDYLPVTVTEAQETRFLNGGSLDLSRLRLPKIALWEGMRFRVCREGFLGLGKVDLASNQLIFVKQFC